MKNLYWSNNNISFNVCVDYRGEWTAVARDINNSHYSVYKFGFKIE